MLDKLIGRKIKDELSKMHSPETRYRKSDTGCNWTLPDRICRLPSASRKPKTACTCPEDADGKIAFNYHVKVTKNILGRRVCCSARILAVMPTPGWRWKPRPSLDRS